MNAPNNARDILIVDDTIENLKILVAMLSQAGYHVRPVNNGTLALQIARNSAPDLILLDIRMPNMDGYQVCEQLKSNPATHDIPIIFISAQHNLHDKLQAFRAGGVDYITKPFQLEEVQARVETQIKLQELRQRDQEHIQNLAREIETRKKIEAQLREYQQNLEQLVAERTAELEKSLKQERAMRTQLIQADRLISMGRLSASIAHEIKNPMQSILGCLGLAKEAIANGQPPDKYLEVAEKAVYRVTHIINQMRDLNRSTHNRRTLVDLNTLLDEVLLLTKKQAEQHNIEVVRQAEIGVQPIWGVANQLNQVFLNLVLNALESMPEGGQLQIIISQTDDPSGVKLEFRDNGVGIAPEHLPHIFESFFTTKSEGFGLGLAISYEIIHQHRGKLEVTSQVGKGSTFTVWLPTTLR